MKKFLLGTVVVTMLASCSKNEVNDYNTNSPNAISFSSYVGMSRAVENKLDQLNDNFTVLAFTNGANNGDLFNNANVTKDALDWSYSSPVYWPTTPNKYAVEFYATSPAPTNPLSVTNGTVNTFEYTVDNTIGTGVDFLVASQKYPAVTD